MTATYALTAPLSPPADLPRTLGALRATDHVQRPVKAEIRTNLLARLAAGEPSLPGIVGFTDTVLPEIERALLAGHDMVLLGERGQGKTRLIRTLIGLLDEWTPTLSGSELNEHPYAPITVWGRRQVAEHGESTPVTWVHRSDRFGEKLATPDTSVGDLIGDVDPIKVAEGRTLGDPETVHYGLVPRTNRGIFSINELPDLAERIQVALLNVLEERDIQIRGYRVRLPLDLLLVASANPEDYTNRGRIVTPLKDRFGTEVRTHYPLDLRDEIALLRQEAELRWDAEGTHGRPVVPAHLVEIIARYTRLVRESQHVDQRSGVSARFAIAALETVAASAVRRAAITGETTAAARVSDLPAVVPASRGKVEFADSDGDEDGRETEILAHLLRRATNETFRARLGGLDLSGLQEHFSAGEIVESGDMVPAARLLAQVGRVPRLAEMLGRLGVGEGEETPEQAAAALELALEGLHLSRRLAKDSDGGRTVYGK
ncbi:MAG: sigma 54-interacting transcriptional regulator [Geodermatophilaceae bacterium]|nr:sigma 54-interacting transcriptional regulator [Geodermatophilaceae bacterium]